MGVAGWLGGECWDASFRLFIRFSTTGLVAQLSANEETTNYNDKLIDEKA